MDNWKIISDKFAAKYKNKKVNWGFNGLGGVVYARTYSRIKENGEKEQWYETIQRCINGAQKIGADYTKEEAERLFDHVFNLRCNFAGRMLWQLGTPTVDRFCANSLLNCWGVTMNEPKSFLFLMENLMLGGGVGFSVRREDIHELPRVKKGVEISNDLDQSGKSTKDADFIVPDSREGWVHLVGKVLKSYFETGKGFSYSTILIRGKGEPIHGFGGKASGPGILIDGVEDICKVFDGRVGRKLRSVDVLDICNILGAIIVAGNLRRCIPHGALVHCEGGLKPIQQVEAGDKVLTSDGYEKVSKTFEQGVQETIKINTQDGFFECTPNHRMARLTSVDEYEWVEALTLKSGDRLVNTRQSIEGGLTELPKWSYDKPNNSTTCQDISIPELDADMAWFIGLFHGDGYTYANRDKGGFNAYVSLVFGLAETEIAEKAKTQLERFGLKNVTLSQRKGENSLMVHCQSKQIAWYFDEFIKKPNSEIKIPDFILKASKEVKLAYVSGVFDSDGSNGRPLNIVTTVYEGFALGIQNLLYSCGVESRFRENSDNIPSRPNHWQKLYFVNLITSAAKSKFWNFGNSLKEVVGRSKSSNANSFPSQWIKDDRSKCHAGQNKNVNIDRYEEAKGLNLNLVPCEVISIEKGREVETFDIEVENKHEFFCNGYLTHNSAEIAIGDPDDYLFLRAKRWDLGDIPNHRAMSNNTIYCDSFNQTSHAFWDGYSGNGEPYGLFNLPLSEKYGRLIDGPMKKSDLYPQNKDGAVVTNPCGEISLSNFECCNLSELYLNRIESKEQAIECGTLLQKAQKAICAMPFLHEETNEIVHKNMRIGLGVTGVCQSFRKLDWLDDVYRALRKFDNENSKKRGWPSSIKLTTNKPSGSLSLLAGSTPGVHPAYDRYYIRRVRMASSDELVHTCREAGYKVEFVQNFDGTEDHGTVVVEFPCYAGSEAILAKDMSAVNQLEIVKRMQTYWSDNAVSCTVYYRKEELEEIKSWLKKNYKNSIKSVSFLLHSEHGFSQAPYESITKEEYEKMIAKVKPLDSIGNSSEMLDMEDCAGGACPIR